MARRGNPNLRKQSIHDGAPDVAQGAFLQSLHRTDTLAARSLAKRFDGYRNMVSGLGTFRDRSTHTHFTADLIPFDLAMEIWRGDDMANRVITELPKEAKRKGWDLVMQGDDGSKDLGEAIKGKTDLLGADTYLQQAGECERGIGGAAVFLGVNDGTDDLTKPLNLKSIISLDFLNMFEARELFPLYGYADPRAPKFGQPEIYQLVSRSVLPSHSGKYAAVTMQIHESRLIIFPGLRVSRYQIAQTNGGWGDSVLVRLWRVLRAFNEIFGNVEHLIGDFAQAVYKLKGLYDSLSEDDDSTFVKRLQAMDIGRSTIRALVLDAEDTFERQSTPMTGIPDLLREFGVRLAAGADMPLTRLFGTSPAGMNATGESDISMWDDRVAAYQQDKLKPGLRRIVEILMFLETHGKGMPEKWDVHFRPLRQPTELQVAQTHQAQSMADLNTVNAGMASAEELALARFGGKEYSLDTHLDFGAREQQEQVASPPVSPAELAIVRPGMSPSKDYVPPPVQGTANEKPTVAPPGPAAAPDPRTPPQYNIQSEDSARAVSWRRQFRADFADRWRSDRDVAGDVEAQLRDDYPPEAMTWIRGVPWEGPERVPLAAIDFEKSEEWRAASEPDKVDRMHDKIEAGWEKPMVLVHVPGEAKLRVVDGHHRALAYRAAGHDPLAFVGEVPRAEGPWDSMHNSQRAKPAT